MTVDLRTGDSLEILKTLDANSIDSVVTDPPYGLSFMGKKWDYDVPTTELWKEVLRVLKPGGHLLSFSSSRTYHRMTVNVEDAGFEIRDQIMWVYGSGFPKSHNIGKAYEAKLKTGKSSPKAMREARMGEDYKEVGYNGEQGGKHFSSGLYDNDDNKDWNPDNPHTGWGTALKPSHEPIVLARKPLSEKTVVDNVIKWGTGGINIDKSRVEYQSKEDEASSIPGSLNTTTQENSVFGVGNKHKHNTEGRFPANFIHDGSDEVMDLFPNVKTGSINKGQVNRDNTLGNSFLGQGHGGVATTSQKASDGSAGRFFYCAKVSKSERNVGLEEFEEKAPVGRSEEQDKLNVAHKLRTTPRANPHPTVKPVKLMSYLVNLVTPVSGTVLDPFMGSGSTGMACKQEGFDFIGIDLDESYVEIAKARIDGWKN